MSCTSSSSSSAHSVMRRVRISRLVTLVKPVIRLERDLKIFSVINLLMTLLQAQLTAFYSLNKRTSCLWVLNSLDKIVAVGAGSGMNGRTPGFLGVTNTVLQWVLNMAGCAVKTRYTNVLNPNAQSTADDHEFR